MVVTLWVHHAESKIDVIDCPSKVKVLENPRTAWPVQATQQPKVILACVSSHSPKSSCVHLGVSMGQGLLPAGIWLGGCKRLQWFGHGLFPGSWMRWCPGNIWLTALLVCLCNSYRSACPAPVLGSTGQHVWPAFHKSFVMRAQPCHDTAMALGCSLECSGYVQDCFCHAMYKVYYQLTSQAAGSPVKYLGMFDNYQN